MSACIVNVALELALCHHHSRTLITVVALAALIAGKKTKTALKKYRLESLTENKIIQYGKTVLLRQSLVSTCLYVCMLY